MILSNVDLPHPEGLMIEKNSPDWTSSETSLIAVISAAPLSASPKSLLTLRRVRMDMDLFQPVP